MNTTCDELLNGKLKLIQPKQGPRVNLDTVLLASWVRFRARHNNYIELGCAAGAVTIMLAQRNLKINITGVDIQEDLIMLARENLSLNNFNDSERIKFIAGDLRDKKILPEQFFDAAIMNPPYTSNKHGRASGNKSRMTARIDDNCTPEDLARAVYRILKSRGRFFTVFKSERMAEFLAVMIKFKLMPKRIKFIFPKHGSDSNIFLCEFIKDGGEILEIMPPMFVYNSDGSYTEELLSAYN